MRCTHTLSACTRTRTANEVHPTHTLTTSAIGSKCRSCATRTRLASPRLASHWEPPLSATCTFQAAIYLRIFRSNAICGRTITLVSSNPLILFPWAARGARGVAEWRVAPRCTPRPTRCASCRAPACADGGGGPCAWTQDWRHHIAASFSARIINGRQPAKRDGQFADVSEQQSRHNERRAARSSCGAANAGNGV